MNSKTNRLGLLELGIGFLTVMVAGFVYLSYTLLDRAERAAQRPVSYPKPAVFHPGPATPRVILTRYNGPARRQRNTEKKAAKAPAKVARATPVTKGSKYPYVPPELTAAIKNHLPVVARRYGIDAHTFTKVAEKESSYNPYVDGDGGEKGVSRGLFQINEKAHPEVPPHLAYDPWWSMEWAAQRFSQGHAREWTTYRNLRRTYSW